MLYNGPATVVLTDSEIRHLAEVLKLYPRAENAWLRKRIQDYLESQDD